MNQNYFRRILSYVIFFAFFQLNAQTVNTDYATQINSTFANLDKTKVPNKLLIDYAMEFEELSAFGGTMTADNIIHRGNYTGIYNTLLMARVQAGVPGLVNPTTFRSNWEALRAPDKIVLSGLYYKYSQFKPNASPNYVTVTNNKLYDKYVSGVWQNPYDEKQVFAIAAPVIKYNSLTMQVQLPSALWYTNQSAAVQSIAIDFGDGLGYQAMAFGQLKTVAYTQPGLYEWKYKLTLTPSQILYSHSKIQIDGTAATALQRTISQPCAADAFGNEKVQFTGTRTYNTIAGSATLEIHYATANCTITKPLIVVEGFDSGLMGVENPLGENYYEKFRFVDLSLGGSNLINQINTYDIIYVNWNNGKDYLQRNAYLLEDIIKWVNNVKSGSTPNVVLGQSMGGVIARYALRDMENMAAANPGTPAWQHKTSLYISHDAPHQGANIPLGIQYFARHLIDQFVGTPLGDMNINVTGDGDPVTIEDLKALLNAPGTQQLLISTINSGFSETSVISQAWLNELKAMGYPQLTRNIAISNGNHCAVPQDFAPADNLFRLNGSGKSSLLTDFLMTLLTPITDVGFISLAVLFNEPGLLIGILPGNSKFNMDFKANAMPAPGMTAEIYKGNLTFTKKLFWLFNITVNLMNMSKSNSASSYSYDYYPGGKYPIPFDFNGVSGEDIFQSHNITAYIAYGFDFIPVPSALDIGLRNVTLTNTDYLKKYNSATPPVAPKISPFANFITGHNPNVQASQSNENHISFNPRNGNWLATEIDSDPGNAQIFNCQNFCADAAIIGSDFLCSTGNYSVTTEATSGSWYVTEGNSLVTLSNNTGITTTLTPVNPTTQAYITLNVTFGNSRCGSTTASKRIWIGNPKIVTQGIYGGYDSIGINQSTTVNVHPATEASQYYWFITPMSTNCGQGANGLYPPGVILPRFQTSSGYASTLTGPSPSALINVGNCPGEYAINCRAVNACGTTDITYRIITVYVPGGTGADPCPQGVLQVYPNPVMNGEFEVDIRGPIGDPCPPTLFRTGGIDNQVKIYDLYGNLVFSETYKTDNIKITGLKMKRGHYVLNVFSLKGKVKREIIIVE